MAPIRVLHLDDDDDLADAMARALSQEHGIVAERAATVAEARARLAADDAAAFAAALVDLKLPDGDGASILPLLYDLGVPAIVMCGDYESERAPDLAAWGALAVPKPARPEVVARVIRLLLERGSRRRAEFAARHGLSERELEVVVCAAEGMSTEQAAAHLGCADTTVAEHWQRVFTKLGVRGRKLVLASYQRFLRG